MSTEVEPITEQPGSLPYVSAGTFITTLDHIGAVGAPNIVDRNGLPPSFSGSSKYDTLHAFRYLKLIDKEGRPNNALLDRLVNTSTRKEALGEILKEHYSELIALPLSNAGPTEVNRWFSEHASSSTAAKAKAFFIALAKQVGLPMHPLVASAARSSSGSIRRKRKRKPEPGNPVTVAPPITETARSASPQVNSRLHPAVQAWIDEMPANGEAWDMKDFEEWLSIFRSSIMRAYKIGSN